MPFRRVAALNLPNRLTLLRLGFCGLLLISLSIPWRYPASGALLLFTLASLTDWLDGAIARARNLVTDLGKLLDPLADKILITGTLVGLVERHVAPMWMVVVIIAREFLITGLRTIAAHKQVVLAAERIGKHKTISQMVAILVSLAALALGEFGLGGTQWAELLHAAERPLYWIALAITVWSGVVYFGRNAAMFADAGDTPVLPHRDEATSNPANLLKAPSQPMNSPLSFSTQPAPAQTSPAFKDWSVIIEALGRGAQIIILRKGGIAEGRGGFAIKAPRFWLFPTRFHQQSEKTTPALRDFVPEPEPADPTGQIVVRYVAELTENLYLTSWAQVARLEGEHFWSESLLRERFGYADRPGLKSGLNLLILRVSRLDEPHVLSPSPAFEGCKSWIEVPLDFKQLAARPVLDDTVFAERQQRILAAASPRVDDVSVETVPA